MQNSKKIIRWLMCWFLFWGTGTTVNAQFNPDNPPEPQVVFNLVVKASPEHMGYTSGTGTYTLGEQAWIGTSSKESCYHFMYWTKDGEKISTDQYFNYKINAKNDTLIAHYKFLPDNPDEPSMNRMRKLFLKSEPEGCCSFNLNSGIKHREGEYLYIDAYRNPGYQLVGWYEGDSLVNDYSTSFGYIMPERNVTLTAKFKYSPQNPDDPNSDGSQQDIDNPDRGDANNDGNYSVDDAVLIGNIILDITKNNKPMILYDANNDGRISIGDIVVVINNSLSTKK